MQTWLGALTAFVMLVATPPPSWAATVGAVVDTDYVKAAAARGVVIWDVRGAETYRKGHIPGAVNVDFVGASLRDPQTEDYIPLDDLERVLGRAGIDPFHEVVVYGDKASSYTYFAAVTLRYLGGGAPRIYHGGIDDWVDARQPLARGDSRRDPVTFKARPDRRWALDTAAVRAKVGDRDVQIVDARTPDEYSGRDIRALRGGHIPGAVNIPYEQNWQDPDAPRKIARGEAKTTAGLDLKTPAELRALYRGLDPSKETIVYCQSGVRASQTAEILKGLGFDKVQVYDASWLGWGNTFDAPAASVTYFDVGRVNARLRALEGRIKQLEEALAGKRR